jgi:hypothetical protein
MRRSPARPPSRGWNLLLGIPVVLAACREHPPSPPAAEPVETLAPGLTARRIASPSGARIASVVSSSRAGQGFTQVTVDFDDSGGGGVFTIELPDVPLRVGWRDEAHLVIGYPVEVVPSKRDPSTYYAGKTVEIEYETFTGAGAKLAAIREQLAKEAREARPDEVEKLVRGRIVGASPDQLRYEYLDIEEPDSSYADLEKRGFQGGGESWAGIVEALIALEQPDLRARVRFDPEAEILVLWSRDRRALQDVARLIDAAKRDRALFERAVETARATGTME